MDKQGQNSDSSPNGEKIATPLPQEPDEEATATTAAPNCWRKPTSLILRPFSSKLFGDTTTS
eukprot:scaffold840_cov344-Pavlova_lutheri.AAC.139